MYLPKSKTRPSARAETPSPATPNRSQLQLLGGYEAQRQALAPGGGGSVQEIAASGVRGAGGSLPHVEAIQRSFGPQHDVRHVQAHTAPGATAALNAEAYATQGRIEDTVVMVGQLGVEFELARQALQAAVNQEA